MPTRRQVLVVDHEPDQLQTLSRGLLFLGIDCLTARTVAEAVALLGGPAGERVDLLLADLSVRGRLGAQLVERARALRPGLPVLMVAGLALSPEVVTLRARGIPILRKPFTPDQLGRAIEATLADSRSTSKGERQ